MRPNVRSAAGIVLMLGIIPIFAGLLACMPVPIGDPEKSRIDDELSGVWAVEVEDEGGPFYFFRPYDKRTWLILATLPLDAEGEELLTESAQETLEALASYSEGETDLKAEELAIYKAWLKKLGGATFMTWENIGGYDEDGLVLLGYWFVWKVEKAGPDKFSLRLVNPEHDAFDDLQKPDADHANIDRVRRQWERALKKAADDPELYVEDSEVWTFHRVPPELLEDVFELFDDVIEYDE